MTMEAYFWWAIAGGIFVYLLYDIQKQNGRRVNYRKIGKLIGFFLGWIVKGFAFGIGLSIAMMVMDQVLT